MAPITIPKYWAMFTPVGNKSIEKKATRLVEKLESSEVEGKGIVTKLKYIKQFACGVTALGDTKTMSEAMDTDVRDHVSSFMRDVVARKFNIPEDAIRTIERECGI